MESMIKLKFHKKEPSDFNIRRTKSFLIVQHNLFFNHSSQTFNPKGSRFST